MSNFHSPPETASSFCGISQKKATNSTANLIILGILAGVYIGFGAQLATMIMSDLDKYLGLGFAKFIGGSVFSVGLMLVILAGAELFTGNSLIVIGYLNGDIKGFQLLRNWIIIYFANFIGSILLVYLMYATGLWKTGAGVVGAKAVMIANGKVNLSLGEALARGILCNWMVCLAIWLAIASKDVIGKIFGIFFPIMAFVASGFEHSIANMYFVPMGIILKGQEFVQQALPEGIDLGNLTWGSFIGTNLIPVTVGNIIGGAFFVGVLYWYIYLKPEGTSKSSESGVNISDK